MAKVMLDTPKIGEFRGRSMRMAHLGSTDIDALHELAAKIGLKREWFQDHPRHPHYDLLGIDMIKAAWQAGASQVTPREFVAALKQALEETK